MPLDARTKLFLLLGNPVEHSLSPAMHNGAFEALGLNCAYLAAQVEKENIEAAITGMKALSIAGANVTIPHKETVIPYLDSLSPEAQQVGSVNTIINRYGHLTGTTTDGEGFYLSLQKYKANYEPGQTALMVGAGGAARAVAFALANKGAREVIVANRSESKGLELSNILLERTPLQKSLYLPLDKKGLAETLPRCDLIVYSLPFNLPEFKEALALGGPFKKNQLFFDLRYKPDRTEMMALFQEKGGDACNGLAMLIWQAVKSFETFTGQAAPVEVMQRKAGL